MVTSSFKFLNTYKVNCYLVVLAVSFSLLGLNRIFSVSPERSPCYKWALCNSEGELLLNKSTKEFSMNCLSY